MTALGLDTIYEDKTPPTEGQWIEALDRSYIASTQIESLFEHKVFKYDAEIREQADKAMEIIAGLYQLIGDKIPQP